MEMSSHLIYLFKDTGQIIFESVEGVTKARYAWPIKTKDYTEMESFHQEIKPFFENYRDCSTFIIRKEKKSFNLFLSLLGSETPVPGLIIEFDRELLITPNQNYTENRTILHDTTRSVTDIYTFLTNRRDELFK